MKKTEKGREGGEEGEENSVREERATMESGGKSADLSSNPLRVYIIIRYNLRGRLQRNASENQLLRVNEFMGVPMVAGVWPSSDHRKSVVDSTISLSRRASLHFPRPGPRVF